MIIDKEYPLPIDIEELIEDFTKYAKSVGMNKLKITIQEVVTDEEGNAGIYILGEEL